ncbi:MAG TPA: hypothetical protein VGH80_03940 [Xanthomonadaceae bacterium]|jgi:tetratricopeptide (TPR) repeat protein
MNFSLGRNGTDSQRDDRDRPEGNGRPERGPSRRGTRGTSWWIALIALQSLALFAGWRVLTLGLAAAAVDSDPRAALYWRPGDREALLDASDEMLRKRDVAMAAALARRAMIADPLDGRPYRNLAYIADAAGDRARAKALFGIAKRRSPRDVPTRDKLLEYAVKDEDYPAVFRLVDFQMRIQPQSIATYAGGLVAIAQDPKALKLLSGLLAKRPPWREYFLGAVADLDTDPEAIDSLFASRGSDEPLRGGGTEADLLLQRQMRDARWSNAYITWIGTLTKAQRSALGNIYDGDFRFQPSGRGFDWQLPADGTGYDVVVGSAGKPVNRNVLEVSFDGLPLDYRPVRQRLILGPGRYRFAGMGLATGLSGDGMYWDIACEDGQQRPLMQTKAFVGDMPWQPFATEFEVPAEACPTQWLQLDLALGRLEPQPMEGSAVFSGVTISRTGDAAPASVFNGRVGGDTQLSSANGKPPARLQ